MENLKNKTDSGQPVRHKKEVGIFYKHERSITATQTTTVKNSCTNL
jgi:hypothetical protein